MNVIKTIAATLLALVCAACTLIVLIQEDAWFKQAVQKELIATCSTLFDCQFHAEVTRINLFTGHLQLKHISVCPKFDDAWHWNAEKIDITINMLASYQQKKAIAALALHRGTLFSRIEQNQLAILPHLQKFIMPTGAAMLCEVRSLTLQPVTCTIEHNMLRTTTKLSAQAHLHTQGNDAAYRFRAQLHDGSCSYGTTHISDALTGTVEGSLALRAHMHHAAMLNATCKLLQPSTTTHCTVQGKWSEQIMHLTCTTDAPHLQGHVTLDIPHNHCSLNATAPLTMLAQQYNITSCDLTGTIALTAQSTMTHPLRDCNITIALADVHYKQTLLPRLDAALCHTDNIIRGTLNITHHTRPVATGSCIIDHTTLQGSATLTNSMPLRISEASLLQVGDVICSCSVNIPQQHADVTLAIRNEPVVQATAHATTVTGMVHYPLIRLAAEAYGIHLPGKGTMHCTTTVHDGIIETEFAMRDGNIRVPHTYNIIRDMYGIVQFDTKQRALTLHDCSCTLHKGALTISRATAYLDESYQLLYSAVPCLMKNCFLGINKDLFALISGALTLTYKKNAPARLNGCIVLDRAQMRNNILSEEFRKSLLRKAAPRATESDLLLGINVMTSLPVRVKTAFLEASAHAQLTVAGTLASPALTGNITLTQGSFLFPYKPLRIKRGTIYFLPQQLEDPVVDIVAENNVRNYAVRMTVDGTAKNSRISFDATPALPEEQIVALLLGGSEHGALFLAMPHSVTESIEKLIFGPAESTSRFQRTLKNLFSPLKNLRVIPSFSDQTARGGLRGSLVIDVNDRLRGIIEHNFSLPEDVVIQVEYDLSDDARIRAIKDERGDLGAELEARWKF